MRFIIILAQSPAMAAIEIVVMLLVAAIIGYLTAYFYYRRVYTRIIQALEKEKDDLNTRITKLNAEKNDLELKVKKLDEEIAAIKDKEKKARKNTQET